MKINGRDRGATLPIVALVLPVLILMTAFAVDLGRQRSSRRTMQARADVIALDLVRLTDGRTLQEIIAGDAAHDSAVVARDESADRNDLDPAQVTLVEWGTFTPAAGFIPSAILTSVPDAVRVTVKETTDYFFQLGSGDVTRQAVASLGDDPVTDLTVGSVAAGFQPTIPNSVGLDATVQALNARLAAQFGATVPNPGTAGFDLVGYRGLAAADVELRRVATNAGFASPDEMLASNMTVGQFFSATATALDQQAAEGDPNAAAGATQLRRFQTQMGVDSTGTMRLGDTFAAEQGGDSSAASASANVLELLSGSADVIDGESFASYQFAPAIPGVAVASVQQYLVRRATFAPGLSETESAVNRQVRLQIDLQVAPLLGMTQPVYIPLVVEAATATGTVDRLTCADPLEGSEAEIGVDTSGITVRLGTATDLSADQLVVQRGVIIQGGGLTVSALLSLGLSLAQITGLSTGQTTTATASASLLGGSTQLVFNPYQDPPTYQRAPGGIGALTLGAQLASSLSASLGNSLLGTTAMTNMANQLSYVFNNLDSAIIDPLLAASGVAIAGADVLADNMLCDDSSLMLVG